MSRDDVIELNIENGLLSGAETDITDRTLDIVLELAKSTRVVTDPAILRFTRNQTGCDVFLRTAVIDPTVTDADNKINDLLSGTNLLIRIGRSEFGDVEEV